MSIKLIIAVELIWHLDVMGLENLTVNDEESGTGLLDLEKQWASYHIILDNPACHKNFLENRAYLD